MEVLKSAFKGDPLGGEILDEILDTVSSSLPLFLSLALAFLSPFLLGVIHAPPSLRACCFYRISLSSPPLSLICSIKGASIFSSTFLSVSLSVFLLFWPLYYPQALSKREKLSEDFFLIQKKIIIQKFGKKYK